MKTPLQKYIPWMLALVIFVLFLKSFDIQEYRAHRAYELHNSHVQEFLTQGTIKTWPISETWMTDMIDSSEKRVWVGVYTFTVPSLRESLLRAKKRGVDVRVILEKFPFWNTSINKETKLFFEKNSIPFHESGEKQFAFMHAKYMVIDDVWVLETANWTRASFTSNREFFLIGTDPNIHENLVRIFEMDFRGEKGVSTDARLLAWPTHARESLMNFLDQTEKNIAIYAPSFSDEALLTKLTQLCHEQKIVRILLANYDDEKQTVFDRCIQVRKMNKPLHAKSIIRDKQSVFLGSFNFTQNSLEDNREIGVFLSWEITKSISQSFESDWKQSEFAPQ